MRTLILISLVAFIAVFSNAYANDELEYILTAEKIQKVTVGKVTNGIYNVSITLIKSERKVFERITEENVGRKLRILHHGKKLMSPIIQGRIESGIIAISDFNTPAEAGECVKSLLSD